MSPKTSTLSIFYKQTFMASLHIHKMDENLRVSVDLLLMRYNTLSVRMYAMILLKIFTSFFLCIFRCNE